ncbi:MAG: DUF3240 family protein [Rhodospirillaceae bacterium]|nr:DUF3240 family protein [Rhodospirillaceae bacterium]MDD9913717.1 DUF3240 family protein [Rhodospirillaceae bacterium]MDD9929522.1 DUF3240 family protein [Rhodospirillaceae bacterium]
METTPKVRLDILIEQLAASRLEEILTALDGVSGYTVLPVQGGSGLDGLWTRDGQVGHMSGMVMVWCIIDRQQKDAVLEAVFSFVDRFAGIVTVSDIEVVRGERF